MPDQTPIQIEKFIPALVGALVGALLAGVFSMRGDVSAGIWLLLPIGAGIGWVGKWIIDRFPDAVDPASETEDPDTVLGPNADSAPPTVDKDMVIELPASNPSAATSPQVIYTTEPSLF
ncbi:MAG: hypothetical protein AAB214_07475, partial [Fibrobacterota bacterium]